MVHVSARPRSDAPVSSVAFSSIWSLRCALLLAVGCVSGCASGPEEPASEVAVVPGPDREFRAAWVATVANIDWPSRPALPVAAQQREARAILDHLVALRMNAVVLQVRPQGDALYASRLEPWSSYLTGTQGEAPSPSYDPLAFWIQEAHRRGLELHAWCNPYRANHPANRGGLAPESLAKARPDLVVTLGDKGYLWMDPSRAEVQEHSLAVMLDIVRRYDVDGLHLDDYFYPYPSYHGGRDFPDDASFATYRAAGGKLARGDWRRAAVDGFIERLYRGIKAVKPRVKFGISPFGIWRPGHPSSIRGFDQYDELFADARRWLREGWVDYFTPQLYWPIAQVPQSFPVLLGWWSRENVHARHLWPGTSTSRHDGRDGATEVVNQIMITRAMLPESPGLCMFSMKSLQRPRSPLPERLQKGPFARRALVPASPWLDARPPSPPEVRVIPRPGEVEVAWHPTGEEAAFLWVTAVRRGDAWSHEIHPAGTRRVTVADAEGALTDIAVMAIDRAQNASVARRLVRDDWVDPR